MQDRFRFWVQETSIFLKKKFKNSLCQTLSFLHYLTYLIFLEISQIKSHENIANANDNSCDVVLGKWLPRLCFSIFWFPNLCRNIYFLKMYASLTMLCSSASSFASLYICTLFAKLPLFSFILTWSLNLYYVMILYLLTNSSFIW